MRTASFLNESTFEIFLILIFFLKTYCGAASSGTTTTQAPPTDTTGTTTTVTTTVPEEVGKCKTKHVVITQKLVSVRIS